MGGTQDISVRVLEQGRRAELRIPAGVDGATLTASLLCTIAANARVQITEEVKGRLGAIAEDFRAAPRDLVVDFAHAIEPACGTPGAWTWEPGFDPASGAPAPASDGGSTDHRASRVLSVAAGAAIARLTPPTEGTGGRTVTGEALPGRRGDGAGLRVGEGLELRPDGAVIARIDGVIHVANGVVSVCPALEIKGCVDFSTGNVDFKGDVVVGAAVRDGFHVHATGHVTLNGPVEGAEVVCGGDLRCPRGIASARRARIVVAGDADLRYLRNARAVIRGDLVCRGELEHSDTTVGGECHCESGAVIGGRLALTGTSHIGTIGSVSWAPTVVSIGDLPLIAMELGRLAADAARVQKAVAAKAESLRCLQSQAGALKPSTREKLTELQYELSEHAREAEAIAAERTRLEATMRQSRGAALHVLRLVHPHVTLQHGATAFEFDKELKGPLQFLVSEHGTVWVRISSQNPRPITDFARPVGVGDLAEAGVTAGVPPAERRGPASERSR